VPGWWRREGRLVVPLGLGIALLATVVAAGLAPDAGLGIATANCTYGTCPATTPFPVWAVTTALAIVVVALLLALLLLRRRKRPGTPVESAPAAEPGELPEGESADAPYGPE
jgi:hypothetical protein